MVLALVLPSLAIVDPIAGMALSLAMFGASVGAVDVAINIQAVMVEKESDRNMMSGFHGLFSVGGIVGAGGMSILLGLGVPPVVATLVFSMLLLVVLAVFFKGLLPYGNHDTGHSPLFTLPRGIVAFIGLLCFLVFLGEGAILDWSALFLIGGYGVDPAQAGFGYTMFALAMTAGRLTGDWIVKTLGGLRVVVGGGLLAALGFLLTVLAPNQLLVFAGFLLVGIGASNIVPVLFTAAGRQTRMPSSHAIAAITTIGYSGILVGPAAIGFVAQHWSLSAAFVLVGAGMAFVACTWPLAVRK
jgi:predicted MFS family arabinose efflux permease